MTPGLLVTAPQCWTFPRRGQRKSRPPGHGGWHSLWLRDKTWDLHCLFLVISGKPPSRLSLPEKGHAFVGIQIPEPRGIFGVAPWME